MGCVCTPSKKHACDSVTTPEIKKMHGQFSSSSVATAQPRSWELDHSAVALYYYDSYGRGEVIRFFLTFLNIDFEDRRLSFSEWERLKSRSDFEQCPLLIIDDKKLVQPRAILRYLAQSHHLYPCAKDYQAIYWLESLCDLVDEVKNELVTAAEKGDKVEIEEAYVGSGEKLAGIEQRLLRNKRGTGWFIGSQISLADISVFELLWDFYMREDMKEKYEGKVPEKLRKYVRNFLTLHTHMGAYMATRPRSKTGY